MVPPTPWFTPTIYGLHSEISAIERRLDINLERNYQKCDIAIHSDSQAAIKALNSYVIDSKMIWECRNKLNEVGKKNEVFLIWVPGHSGIKGNEEANILAKESAQMSLIASEPFFGIGKCTYKKEFLEREKLWQNIPGMDHSTKFLWNFETAGSRGYLDLGGKQLHLILTGFLTGHCRLKKHLLRMELSDTDCKGDTIDL